MIDELPDFAAAKQLARALWQDGPAQRGAACLIGAGFSRNALLAAEDAPQPPLWGDLERAMRVELYPNNARGVPPNPLRLAEEYRTYLGQAALDDLVRATIRDETWRPGPLHDALLRLPWADVLTTNWDTLLERAARRLASPYYSIVRSATDMGHARSPRVIKLHGTIGASEHFIFAEEDYRTYPVRYAPFVNLARQVFIENELVLLGFSGDDPNFLQWSGWVRDQLSGTARRIYLVGVLDLSMAKRKLLEAMNVAPIDLAPLVSTVTDHTSRHERATETFLKFLAASEPLPKHYWQLAASTEVGMPQEEWDRRFRDDAYAVKLLEQATIEWIRERESYPGWLVCPAKKRNELRNRTDDAPPLNAARLALMAPERRVDFLYELAWRHKVAFWPIQKYLYDLFAEAVQSEEVMALRPKERLEIAALLLRAARQADDGEEFEKWASVLATHAPAESDLVAETAYQRALLARDRLNFGSILTGAAAIKTGQDPVWRLRLAGLHSQCGEFDVAVRLITEVVIELNERQAEVRSSTWLRSRRAWAQWLERAARRGQLLTAAKNEDWPTEFADIDADPWDEISGIRDEAAEALRKQREEERKFVPLFLPGTYRDPSATVTIVSSTVVPPADTLASLMAAVGGPERIGYSSLFGALAKDVTELAFSQEDAGLLWYRQWLRLLDSHSDPSLERFLGRVAIARMKIEVIEGLIESVSTAIDFWRNQNRRVRLADNKHDAFAVERLRVLIEVRSRLTARQDATSARSSFALAMDLSADTSLRHMWLREQTGQLADYAVRAMPPSDRGAIVLEALSFPLPGEWGGGFPGYVSPVNWLGSVRPERPPGDLRWASRIAQLISEMQSEANREEACLRLIYLAEESALTDTERQSLSEAIWSQIDEIDPPLPTRTALLPHVFTLLPAPEGIDVQDVVRRRLYGPASGGTGDPLSAITAAAIASRPLRPTREQATRLCDHLMQWQPRTANDPLSGQFAQAEANRMRRLIGPALARAIIPALEPADLSAERGQRALSLIDEKGVVTALWALPFFIDNVDSAENLALTRRIRRGLSSRHSDEVYGAVQAVITWVELARHNDRPQLPAALIEQLISSLEGRIGPGFNYIIQAAIQLIAAELIDLENQTRITTALEMFLTSASHEGLTFADELTMTISLVRTECVRLAAALQALGINAPAVAAWLDAAPIDPLPEVRFALQTSSR